MLILGGFIEGSGVIKCLDSAELYNSDTGAFRFTDGGMPFRACEPEASLLNNGEVLITSGGGNALVYRPETETFRITGKPIVSHGSHADTLLPSGQVLVIGGGAEAGLLLSSTRLRYTTRKPKRLQLRITLFVLEPSTLLPCCPMERCL